MQTPISKRDKLPWLSFDCYDTLVRYSESKASKLEKLARTKGGNDEAISIAQETFKIRERALQLGPFLLLNEILRKSLKDAFYAVNLPCSAKDEEAMINAVCKAPPFADVAGVLTDLRMHFRLAVLSNSEPDIIRHNIDRIGVDMDAVVLASEARCYKPASGMFDKLLSRIDANPADVTHIAQSFYHDISPSKDRGFGQRIWINRYQRKVDNANTPDHEFPDFEGLRNLLIELN